ncbi:TPA: TetR/AcrR family transcriptional regulator [Clostridioides difficile]|nr:TetR/AcrR family transcriptional regulator [Clostridioides difficile]MDC2930353.1 TetR/AcrR family transcriptional regulator [Clostridioides difficile]MDE3610152.1 TetR/AcrR family transcriptional regulator [Clostridioides difficile]MDM9791252.1 TetR/AcrR family transcriptional regulator [Clostridioides difficile]OJT76026.1 TetR family transcriptional regulator [Clostridioides difficile]
MSRDFQQTHENLLVCAKKHFLELGFERASIREICKDAHVTNGAFYNHFEDKEALFGELVDSVMHTVSEIYSDSVEKHFEVAKTDELKLLWKLSEETIHKIIEYVYENFDAFRLLLMRSDGTKYADFLDSVVRLDVRETQKLIRELKTRGVCVHDLEDDEWHMLIHSYYASIAEIVMHNYSKPAALKYAHTLAAFFSSGWQTVLGI